MINSVEEAHKFLSEIENIDYGGCGIAAYSFYLFLERIGIKTKFPIYLCYPVYDSNELYEYYEKDLDEIIHGNFHNVNFCDHVMFDYGYGISDVHGYDYSLYLKQCETVKISIEELIKLLASGSWCSQFNREKNIPIIEEALGIKLCLPPLS